MPEVIFKALSDSDYEQFAKLIRIYVDWCRARYREQPWAVEAAFSYQALDKELEQLSTSYGSPNGATLLAACDGRLQGCVAYRTLSENVCEMKRLYVADQFQGKGLGRKLCESIMREAKSHGFTLMRLDTGNLFHEARDLYQSLGFAQCKSYYEYPTQLMPFLVFMEKSLT